jgi:hypothetical protein
MAKKKEQNKGEIYGVEKKRYLKRREKKNTKIMVEGQNHVCINVGKNN